MNVIIWEAMLAGFKKHKEKYHVHDCESCNNYLVGDSTFAAHNSLAHSGDLLKDIEFEN